jgi:predicted RNA-binding Zn-ribbon protein involved in translation (DUF1610 family)
MILEIIKNYGTSFAIVVAAIVYAATELHKNKWQRYKGRNPKNCTSCGKKNCRWVENWSYIEYWKCPDCGAEFRYDMKKEH